jgi:hypothetical protein
MNDLLQELQDALETNEAASPRTMQSREGILGPSDIGFCRQKAVLVTRQTKPTDEVSHWAAIVGTAIHNQVEAAFKKSHPDWLLGSIDKVKVTATLPSGAVISGHPDIVIPERNMVLDIKTVDGFEWTIRNGPSASHKYQRHLYALGLIDAGILDGSKPVLVGNVYYDRSGKKKAPLLYVDEIDHGLTPIIDSWVRDVIYAVKNGEDSARDVAAAVCQQICEFFTVCRGSLPTSDIPELITDEYLLSAIDMYVDGRNMEKKGSDMKKEASTILSDVNGSSGRHQVRWVKVNSSFIQGYERAASSRLDVREVK